MTTRALAAAIACWILLPPAAWAGSGSVGVGDQRCFEPGPRTGPLQPRVRAVFRTDDDVRAAPIALADGTIVAPSIDGHIYFLNPEGTLKAAFPTSHAGNIASAAVIPDANGQPIVVAGSGDGNLYFLNPDGTKRNAAEGMGSIGSAPVITRDGHIVVGSYDGNLYFYSRQGVRIGKFAVGRPVISVPAVTPDNTVVLGAGDGRVYFLSSDGGLKASFQAGGAVGSPAIAPDGTVVVGSRDGTLYYFGTDGALKASFKTGSRYVGPPAVTADGTVAVGLLGEGPNFIFVNPDRKTLKASLPTDGRFGGKPAIMKDGTVVVGAFHDEVLFLDAERGTESAAIRLGAHGGKDWGDADGAMTSPVFLNDGTVVVGSTDGQIFFIETDPLARPCN